MPRQARIDFPGALHHIMVRGIDRCDIFKSDVDQEHFLDRLGVVLEESGTHCYAFALMTNHVHLLLITGELPISKIMQSLLTGYAIYFNRKYNRIGKLYQNRFKSVLCEEDEYFLELVRYIHLNPIRAGITPTLKDLGHSISTGHSIILGAKSVSWFESGATLRYFGKRQKSARKAYEAFVCDGIAAGHRDDLNGGGLLRSLGGMWEAVNASRSGHKQAGDERILGSGVFVEDVLRRTKEIESRHSQLQREKWNFNNLLRHVAEVVGVSEKDLLMRGRENARARGRALLCKWLVMDLGMMQTDVANRLGVSRSAVSYLMRRGQDVEKDMDIKL